MFPPWKLSVLQIWTVKYFVWHFPDLWWRQESGNSKEHKNVTFFAISKNKEFNSNQFDEISSKWKWKSPLAKLFAAPEIWAPIMLAHQLGWSSLMDLLMIYIQIKTNKCSIFWMTTVKLYIILANCDCWCKSEMTCKKESVNDPFREIDALVSALAGIPHAFFTVHRVPTSKWQI